MHASIIIKILGILLMFFGALGNLPPIVVSWLYDDGSASAFFISFLIIFASGFVLWLVTARSRQELSNRDGRHACPLSCHRRSISP